MVLTSPMPLPVEEADNAVMVQRRTWLEVPGDMEAIPLDRCSFESSESSVESPRV
jgi:hypothetical protein